MILTVTSKAAHMSPSVRPFGSRAGLDAWVEWATEATDVFAQFIAIAQITTASACHKHERQGYGAREDDKRVRHGLIVA